MRAKNKITKMFGSENFILPILIFIFSFITYFLTSTGKTPYDYFTQLAASFLKGKLYLSQNPPWLNELVPINGRYYVVYPPMPAILTVPFVFLFKEGFEQQYLSFIFGAAIAVQTFFLSLKIKKDKKTAILATILTSLGTILWFLSSSGSAWYLAHVISCFFLMVALNESLNKKRAFFVGILLGASYLSRLPTILSIPFFIHLIKGKEKVKNISRFVSGLLPFVLLNFGYNFLRFGTIFDKGYLLIPGVLEEPWYKMGIFNLRYIPRHLKTIFLSFPVFQNKFPYLFPSLYGLSIWITTPAFFYIFLNNLKEKLVQLSWLTIFLISLVIFSHGTVGFAQFGYRFAVDFYPFLIFLTIKGMSKTPIRRHHIFLIFLSVLINFWGVILINKFSWNGF